MIATLNGKITENTDTGQIVLNVGGVGYGVRVSLNDLSSLRIGHDTKLYIHEHIREDSHDLFGFSNRSNKELFEQLLSVKNVGPKVALALLDIGSESEVRLAIAGGDVKMLQSAKGVGKRAAEQVVVELRDKVGAPVGEGADNVVGRAGISGMDEAALGLVALGYSESDALAVLSGIDSDLSPEQRIKLALKGRR
ncbi:MAG: Holliday junction branch migration protein RuvA [bacterium]|nr:Holliday junction branch migration protein RuvA [bacterium]